MRKFKPVYGVECPGDKIEMDIGQESELPRPEKLEWSRSAVKNCDGGSQRTSTKTKLNPFRNNPKLPRKY